MDPGAEAGREFVRLLQRHQQQLFGYILAILHNLADTEDVLQQTSLVLWRKFDQFQPESDFLAWAQAVARLEVKNFLRTRQRDRLLFGDEVLQQLADEQGAQAGWAAPRREALAGCLERLSGDQRRLLMLCYDSEQSIKQIAEREGRTAESLYTTLSRIRRGLFQCIERTLAREAAS